MSRRIKLTLLAAVPLIVAMGVAGLVIIDDEPAARQAPQPPVRAVDDAQPARQVLIVRRRGGVPASWARSLRRTPGVHAVAQTSRTQILMRRSRKAGGATVDAAPAGHAFPLDAQVVQPARFADAVGTGRSELVRLRTGTALLSRTSARLRRLGQGDVLALADGTRLRVAGSSTISSRAGRRSCSADGRPQAPGRARDSLSSPQRTRGGSSAGSGATTPHACGASHWRPARRPA